MLHFVDPVAVGPMIYELILLCIGCVLLTLIYLRYKVKKNGLSRLIFYIFIFYNLGILFSFFGKMITAVYGTTFLQLDPLLVGLLGRIHSTRFSFAFMLIGSYLTYLLDLQLFEKAPNLKKKRIIQSFLGFVVLWCLIVYDPMNSIYTIIAFLFTLIFLIIVYIPFMVKTLKTGLRLTEAVYRRAFFSLSLMALCFIMIFTSFLIDQIMLITQSTRFSFFYYIAWVFVILADLSAYFGYIRPKSKSQIE